MDSPARAYRKMEATQLRKRIGEYTSSDNETVEVYEEAGVYEVPTKDTFGFNAWEWSVIVQRASASSPAAEDWRKFKDVVERYRKFGNTRFGKMRERIRNWQKTQKGRKSP